MADKDLAQKVKDWAVIVALIFSSITSIKFKYDEHGVQLELERTKQALAEEQANNFALSSLCD